MEFQIGDKVEWESQSQGSAVKKKGFIRATIPPGKLPNLVLPDIWAKFGRGYESLNYHIMFDGIFRRNHESYLVLVPAKREAKPKLYWPLVKNLRKVED